MKKSYLTYMDILIITAFAAVPLMWFREGYGVLAGFDFAVYFDPVETLTRSLYLWSDRMAGGYDTSHEVSSIPYYLLFSLPVLLGASLYTAEKFVFASIFVLQGLGAYYMLRVLFSGERFPRAVALSGAVLYTFSYPVMAHFGRGNMMALLTYGLLPVLVGLLYRGFSDRSRMWRYVALVSLLSVPIAATKGHPADFVVFVAVAAAFTLFHAFTSSRERALHIARFSAWTILFAIAVNLWWMVPNLVYLADFGLGEMDLRGEGFYDLSIVASYSSGTSILNVLRNDRLDLWFDIPPDAVWNPGLYAGPVFIMAGLTIPVLAYLALCFEKRDRNVLFFALLGVVTVFLYKGSHAPFGRVFEWLYLNVPGFLFFRAPYRVFSSLLAFSLIPLVAFLLGRAASSLVKKREGERVGRSASGDWAEPLRLTSSALEAIFSFCVVMAVISVSALLAWPVFTGTHLREFGTKREPGVFHNIPGGYAEASNWLGGAAEREEFKVYYPHEVYDSNTTWGYNGPDPAYELLDVDKVVSRPNGTVYVRYQRPIESLNRVVWDMKYGELGPILGAYNVRYALLHEDLSPWSLPDWNFTEYAASLFEANGLKLRKKTGELSLYENEAFLPRTYAPQKGYILSGTESAFPALSLAGYMKDPFLVMTRDIPLTDLERVLASVDGIIFFDSNGVDAVCDLLWNGYGGRSSGRGFDFHAQEAGRYGIYVKGGERAGRHAFLDGAPVMGLKKNSREDGFKWKRYGVATLSEGRHRLELLGLWSRGGEGRAGQKAALIPARVFDRTMEKVERRMAETGFEVAYLFDSSASTGGRRGEGREGGLDGAGGAAREDNEGRANGQGGVITIPGNNGYSSWTMAPKTYERVKKDAMKLKGWDIEVVEGRVEAFAGPDGSVVVSTDGNSSFPARVTASAVVEGVEAGMYPDLDVEVRGAGPDARTSLALKVATDDGLEQSVMILDEVRGGFKRTVGLVEAVKKRLAFSTTHRLTGLEWEVFLPEPGEGGGRFVIKRTALTGRFGVEVSRCGGKRGVDFSVGSIMARAGKGAPCGEWVKVKGKMAPGPYGVRVSGGKGAEGLLLIAGEGGRKGAAAVTLTSTVASPVRRVVRAGGRGAGKIVFSDSFDRGWRLSRGKRSFAPVKVNGFANGFFVEDGLAAAGDKRPAGVLGAAEADGPEAAVYTIEFLPQWAYVRSAVLSAAALCLVVGLWAGRGWKGRKVRRDAG
ncbi:MAG: alpha-(1-_3)-arabinofuranosyltransferase family protein [Thermodesulfobacteriota bacterium]